jgi:hypothetical protein
MSSSDSTNSDDSRFRPGQLGLKHLLAVLAIVSIVMAFAGAQLRTQPPRRIAEFFGHWLLVAVVTVIWFYFQSLARQTNRLAAGELMLRVTRVPMTETRRKLVAWVVLVGAVGSAIFMSVVALPSGFVEHFVSSPGSLFWIIIGQGALWRICLDHWLANVHWVEFREHGILVYDAYFPWSKITRIGWSPTKSGNLVFSCRNCMHELPIDPGAHDEVDALLKARSGR